MVDSNDASHLGATKNGVPLFQADGDIYSFDIASRLATRMFDGDPFGLNSSMMDILGEGMVLGLQPAGGTQLDLFYLPVGVLTDTPFHTVTGIESKASTIPSASGCCCS